MKKQAIVVLGMHRSGTSLLAKALEIFEYNFSENLMQPNSDNPSGFWEDIDIVELNESLLSSNQVSWDIPIDPRSYDFSNDFKDRARRVLDNKFSERSHLIIKDPRISILLKFWSERFADLDVHVNYVVSYRNPLSVASSLKYRDGIDLRAGLLLNYFYNRSIIEFSSKNLFIVDYLSLLKEPSETLVRLAQYLNSPIDNALLNKFVDNFVNPELNHYETGSLLGNQYPDIAEEVSTLSRLMEKTSKGEPSNYRPFFKKYPSPRTELLEHLHHLQLRRLVSKQENLRHQLDELSFSKKQDEFEIANLKRVLGDREKDVSALQEDLIKSKQDELEIADLKRVLGDREKDVSQLKKLIEKNEKTYQNRISEEEKRYLEVSWSISFRLGRFLTYPLRKPFVLFLLPRLEHYPFLHSLLRLLRAAIANPVRVKNLFSVRRVKRLLQLFMERGSNADAAFQRYERLLKTDNRPVAFPNISSKIDQDISPRNIVLGVSTNPVVSVVIPVFNQIEYTLNCLKSISENRPNTPFEVIVVDDCSSDRTPELVNKIEGLRVLTNSSNLGFLRSCNVAAKICKGQYIFLLNNDTRVTKDWLDALVRVFEHHEDAGIVGSKLLYPDGSLQEAGGIIWRDGSGWNYGRNQDPLLPEFNYLKKVDYVSGAAILFRADWFRKIKGFDERFSPAYYEDTDLAFRAREEGTEVYYQPQSVLIHYEGKSHGRDENSGVKKNQLINQQKFLKKWSRVLREGHYDNGSQILSARERSGSKTTVLVIDHHVPLYDQDAGSRSTFQYLKLLVSAGCNVKFLGDNFFKHEPYTAELEAMGIEVLAGEYYRKNWKPWLESNSGYVDIIYLMRPHVAQKYLKELGSFKKKPKLIYFGHDLHYLRLQRPAEVERSQGLEKEAAVWKKREFQIFGEVDLIYYPSEAEVVEILKVEPSLPVKSIPLYCFDNFERTKVDFKNRQDLLFIGGFNHPPNLDGLMWFVKEVYPIVTSNLEEVKLHVVGSNMPQHVKELASKNIVIEGYMDDVDLMTLYEKVRLSIVPLRYGAGVKGKVLEALKKGVPVVTTDIGAEGIPESQNCLIIENEANSFAKKIIDVYERESELALLSERGCTTIEKNFSRESVLKKIATDFWINNENIL
ncbi:MAG: glycosyltransferase [Pseudomonadota bacterium]|nr:glycosyltransferase [Pseudomonadota bacterium]